jgi:tetratricopeptide (TPR) repeat protein
LIEATTTAGRGVWSARFWGGIVGAGIVVAALFIGGWWWQAGQPEARYRRARQALEAGDQQAVWRESQALLKTAGFEPRGRLVSGLMHARRGRFAPALYELQFAARDEALAVEALTVAAECYYRLGQLSEAVNVARTAIAQDPDAIDARRWLASACYDLGAMDEAVAQLEWISARAPDDARPEYLLGLIAKDNERFGEAIDHYREALRRDPRPPNREHLHRELAESLIPLSRFDEALEVLRECERTAASLTLSAECHQNLGRTGEAQELLRTARELDPTYGPACLQEGILFLLLGRAADARVSLEEAVRLAPQSRQAHFHLSQVYRKLGDDVQATEQLQRMQEIQTLEREFSELHGVASRNPTDAEVRFRIGVLADKLGKTELAPMWYRAAVALQPDHAGARAALSDE